MTLSMQLITSKCQCPLTRSLSKSDAFKQVGQSGGGVQGPRSSRGATVVSQGSDLRLESALPKGPCQQADQSIYSTRSFTCETTLPRPRSRSRKSSQVPDRARGTEQELESGPEPTPPGDPCDLHNPSAQDGIWLGWTSHWAWCPWVLSVPLQAQHPPNRVYVYQISPWSPPPHIMIWFSVDTLFTPGSDYAFQKHTRNQHSIWLCTFLCASHHVAMDKNTKKQLID